MRRLYGFDDVADVADLPNDIRRCLAVVFVFVFCAFQLSGCGVVDRYSAMNDAAPNRDIDVSKLRDAVPRVEPLHPYGAKDYVLGGRRYKVLKSSKGYDKKGYASWYGTKFHGKHTSTQERFNLYGMSAASPELPLPSYVQVTNLRNGKKIIVRVNDRGPFHGNRILDLSYAAAKKLGFADRGVAPVRIVAIDPKNWDKNGIHESGDIYAKSDDVGLNSKVQKQSQDHGHDKHDDEARIKSKKLDNYPTKPEIFLQVGAFAKLNNAKRLSDKVNKYTNDAAVRIEHKESIYRVQIGPLARSEGHRLKQLLEDNGFEHVNIIGG